MATLEKIRSKSVFLFVIIIVALLAFILGDFITSGKFYTSSTTMFKVGNQKVDYQHDYQPAMSQAQNNGQNQDGDELAVGTVYELMMQKLFDQEIQKMGIKVTDSEISNLMKGPMNGQFLYSIANAYGLPAYDGESVFTFVNNPEMYGYPAEIKEQLMPYWTNQEKAMEEQMKAQVYYGLVQGLFTANEVDAQAAYNDNIKRQVVDYVAVPVQAGADLEVSDAELKDAYAQMRNRYATYTKTPFGVVEPVRAIDYIVVPIVPSSEDIQAAGIETATLAAALRETEGTDALANVQGFSSQTVTVSRDGLKQNADLRALPEEYTVTDSVYEFNFNPINYTYVVTKVLGIDQRVDDVTMTIVQAPDANALAAVMQKVEEGSTIDQLDNVEGARLIPSNVYNLENAGQLGMPFTDSNFRADVLGVEKNKINSYSDTISGIFLAYEVTERVDPKDFVTVAVIKKVVDPSVETQTNISEKLNSFLASNSTAETFSAAARDSSYILQNGYVSASTPHVANLDGTRRAVKWIMNDAKVGSVSPIYEARVKANPNAPDRGIQNAYLVVAVKDNFTGEYIPYTAEDVRPAVEMRARANKKAAEIANQYAANATTLDAFAEATGQQILADSAFVFSSQRLGTIYGEPAIFGAIAGAQPGQIVGPVQGEKDVVVFIVNPAEGETRPYDFTSDARTFMQNYGMRLQQQPVLFNMLIGDRSVKNSMLKFVADEQ